MGARRWIGHAILLFTAMSAEPGHLRLLGRCGRGPSDCVERPRLPRNRRQAADGRTGNGRCGGAAKLVRALHCHSARLSHNPLLLLWVVQAQK